MNATIQRIDERLATRTLISQFIIPMRSLWQIFFLLSLDNYYIDESTS